MDSGKAIVFRRRAAFLQDMPKDLGLMRKLLEEYSNVPPDEVVRHLYRIREQLWEVAKYPCIGRWGFLRLHDANDPHFRSALGRLKATGEGGTSEALLDVGCCVGQMLRHLAYEGVPTARLFGTDLNPEFIDIGSDMFKDKNGGITFTAGNVLDPDSTSLATLRHRVTIIHAANFLHLFSWDIQVKICLRLLQFLQKSTASAFIFGRQIGSRQSRVRSSPTKAFLHNEKSFQRLWDYIGEQSGTRWRVAFKMVQHVAVNIPGFDEDDRYVKFGVYQV